MEIRSLEAFGLLEHILSFCDAEGLLSASTVSRRWKEAGRSDSLWKDIAAQLWDSKVGLPHKSDSDLIPFFWRAIYTTRAVERMTVTEIRTLFQGRPQGLKRVREALDGCLEKSEIRAAVHRFMPTELGPVDLNKGLGERVVTRSSLRCRRPFDDLWFGSYASSIVDSRRNRMTLDELCSPKGFRMYFKFVEDADWNQDDDNMDDSGEHDEQNNEGNVADGSRLRESAEERRHRQRSHDHTYPRLQFYATCFFDESRDFRMEGTDFDLVNHHEHTWQWFQQQEGYVVQVGPYPPLTISRLTDNWGWRLENVHVVFFSQ